MPIEIKELVVKFSVEEERLQEKLKNGTDFLTKAEKSDIIKQCTQEVLENLERYQER